MDLKNERVSLNSDGVWVDVDETTRLLIGRHNNPEHKKYTQKRMKPHMRLFRMDRLPDSVFEEIQNDGMAKFVLLGWEGLELDDKPVKYSVETAKKILSDPELVSFKDLVYELSNDLSIFRQEEIEEGKENIKKS